MTQPFKWPLSVSTFTLRDKLSIGKWILSQDRYTMGDKVAELEAKFSKLSGMHALCLSSGSAANQMVFELWKLKNPGEKAIVICPAVTWISSVSPAIMAGFDVRFCDVNLTDFSFDYEKLTTMLRTLYYRGGKGGRRPRVIIWPTALIGFAPDMVRLTALAAKYGAELFMDSCENTLSRVEDPTAKGSEDVSILASCDITTTSCYFSHQVVMVEGGFIFLKSREDYELAKMFRNHGLIRSLGPHNPTAYKYAEMDWSIDPQFCFAVPGTNMRATDVHAMFGLRDFERIEKSQAHRDSIYAYYHKRMMSTKCVILSLPEGDNWYIQDKYYMPPYQASHSGFCLPIFTKGDNLAAIKTKLTNRGIECRPLIGSNLLRQPALRGYGKPEDFPNAEWIHKHGCYVGLHSGVTPSMVEDLIDILISVAQ
jgi:CDP-6-deoxy-D-xylo-4-hexulose-3-dehydrase